MSQQEITREELGRRLQVARQRAGYKTLTPVAAAIGKSPDTIANYEAGRSEPTFTAVVILSRLFNVPLEEFVDTNGKRL